MGADSSGICPNCESRVGAVGEPCPEPVCRRKGYALIPRPWFDSARESAARRQRPMDPLLGRVLDRYLLAGKIGEGGMGSVYLALQRPLNREVALKVISGLEISTATTTRFEREARAISLLDHPNIVKLYDYGIADLGYKVPYMALEYVRHGRTLRRALGVLQQEMGGPIPGQVIRTIFDQILHALGAAHDQGIVHRDMKPENVMLTPVRGSPHFVKILDFGLAKAVEDVSGFDGTVSRTGQFLGTPCYMAPEQASTRSAHVDHRADLYAVAVMIYEVFTGVRPFTGETPMEILAQKVDASHRPLSFDAARALPWALRDFLARGFAADPAARFQTAADMQEALGRALSGRTPSATGPIILEPVSSDDRPATPPTPREATEGVGEPTAPIGGESVPEAAGSVPGTDEMTRDAFRRRSWSTWGTVAALVAIVVAAVMFAVGVREPAGGSVPVVDPGADVPPVVSAPALPTPEPPVPVPAAPTVVPAPSDGGVAPNPSATRPAVARPATAEPSRGSGAPARPPARKAAPAQPRPKKDAGYRLLD